MEWDGGRDGGGQGVRGNGDRQVELASVGLIQFQNLHVRERVN